MVLAGTRTPAPSTLGSRTAVPPTGKAGLGLRKNVPYAQSLPTKGRRLSPFCLRFFSSFPPYSQTKGIKVKGCPFRIGLLTNASFLSSSHGFPARRGLPGGPRGARQGSATWNAARSALPRASRTMSPRLLHCPQPASLCPGRGQEQRLKTDPDSPLFLIGRWRSPEVLARLMDPGGRGLEMSHEMSNEG